MHLLHHSNVVYPNRKRGSGMAISDACFQFLTDVAEAAGRLAEEAHHYSAPDQKFNKSQARLIG